MNVFNFFKASCLLGLMLLTENVFAQHKVSFDLAAIRNMNKGLNGLNVSCFNHFNEHIVAGLEVNRFFPVNKKQGEEDIQLSAWDIDLNIQYQLSLNKKWKIYPIAGVSHTSEKEWNPVSNESLYEKFWSFNSGAGMLVELGKWAPHIEYCFTWGKLNQQFLLAGISYELEWGKHEKE